MKKIGFIDYYLSEWHANNYPAWIKKANEALHADFKLAYVWAELEVSPDDGVTTDQWVEQYGVEKCATIEELCEKSDYIVILAPSNPETHLKYAEIVLKYGKNTYIDKTFAPDYATAKKIFEIGAAYGTKFFSTSALRYATELDEHVGCERASVTFGGRSVEEYIIHPTEMLVKLVGIGAKRVVCNKTDNCFTFTVEYGNGSVSTVNYYENQIVPTTFTATKNGTTCDVTVNSDYFNLLILSILRFFQTGDTPFDVAQTLEVMKLREGFIKAKDTKGSVDCGGQNICKEGE